MVTAYCPACSVLHRVAGVFSIGSTQGTSRCTCICVECGHPFDPLACREQPEGVEKVAGRFAYSNAVKQASRGSA